jgi:cobalt-zinc-cadmium efflux system membrane fusion protein
VGQTQAQAEVAEAAFNRADRLLADGIVSQGQWEEKRGAHRRAVADVEAARANLRQGQSKIETAKARLQAAQAKVRAAQARVRQATAAIETATARQEQAEAKLAAARSHAQIAAQTLAREEAVAKGNFLTTREIVEAESSVRQAEIEQQGAEQNVRLLGGQPGGGSTVPLVTPIAGRIQERNVSLGETVDSEHPLFTVLNLDLVWAQLAVAPNDLPLVRLGQKVELTSDTAPGRPYSGTVSSIGGVADEKTRTVGVRCALLNQGGTLRPETFVRGSIITDVRKERVFVPPGALQEHTGKPTVYVVKDGLFGGFEVRHVQLGVKGDSWREVSSGLKAGEKIAVNGTFYLKSEALKSSLSDACCAVDKK